MPKWQISLTRDTSQDAEVIVEAETPKEVEQIFLHDMDRDTIDWREGDWIGDTDIVEVLPAADETPDPAKSSGLDLQPSRQSPTASLKSSRPTMPARAASFSTRKTC